jgi:hypothetical protein
MLLKNNFTDDEIGEVFCDVDHEATLNEMFKEFEEMKKRQERNFQESLNFLKQMDKLEASTTKLEARAKALKASTFELKTEMAEMEVSAADLETSMDNLETSLFRHFRPLTTDAGVVDDKSHVFANI